MIAFIVCMILGFVAVYGPYTLHIHMKKRYGPDWGFTYEWEQTPLRGRWRITSGDD